MVTSVSSGLNWPTGQKRQGGFSPPAVAGSFSHSGGMVAWDGGMTGAGVCTTGAGVGATTGAGVGATTGAGVGAGTGANVGVATGGNVSWSIGTHGQPPTVVTWKLMKPHASGGSSGRRPQIPPRVHEKQSRVWP